MRDNRGMGLPEFVLARISGVEARERAEYQGDRTHYGSCFIVEREYGACDCTASADLLAECEAKRRIVEECQRRLPYEANIPMYNLAMTALRLLALPFAAHPDYAPEWKP